MYSILVTISIIISFVLIIAILLQKGKGGGLAGTFGGGGAGFGTMFGTRRTADFLSKGTWWLGGALMILAIVINLFFLPGQTSTQQRESVIQKAGENSLPDRPTLPQTDTQTPNQ